MRSVSPPRHHAIDLLKGLAIMAVIGIHYMSGLSITSAWIGINQLLRFSVPLFVFLSGYSLLHKYEHSQFYPKEFFTRRVLKVIPLYLLWVGIILLTIYVVPDWNGFAKNYTLTERVLFGRAEYHLYFVPMIFQLYLLFPILLWAIRRSSLLTFIGASILQAAMFLLIDSNKTSAFTTLFVSDQQQYIWFASWIMYFVWGMALRRKQSMVPKVIYKIAVLTTLIGLAWSVIDALQMVQKGVDVIIASRFTRWPIVVYNLGLATTVIGYKESIEAWTQSNIQWLVWIGKHSFLIYLLHTLVIRLFMAIKDQKISLPHALFVTGMLFVGVLVSRKLLKA